MNIEQLRSEWKQYSQKLELTQRLNEQLILSMLKERSRSRIAKVRRQNTVYLVLMSITFIFIVAIFAGNPFDFKYKLQYIPYGILMMGVIIAIGSLIGNLNSTNIDLNKTDLAHFLGKMITGFEKFKKMESWFGLIMFSAGLLTVFSFLPKKLEHKGIWPAMAETMISLLISFSIYYIAYRLGAFRNKNKEAFENDLKELNDLKATSTELRESM